MVERNDDHQWVPCPFCEGIKGKRYLLCSQCRKRYAEEAATLFLEQGIKLTIEEWGERELRKIIPVLETTTQKTKEDVQLCQNYQALLIDEEVSKKIKDQDLPQDVLDRITQKIRASEKNETWRQVGGPRCFSLNKGAEARLQEAERLLLDLENKESSLSENGGETDGHNNKKVQPKQTVSLTSPEDEQ